MCGVQEAGDGMTPSIYYQRGDVTLFFGDCLEVLPTLEAGSVDAVVTDPPYGMGYRSSMNGRFGDCAIAGDDNTTVRDSMLVQAMINLGIDTALIFGNWKVRRPHKTKMILTWDKGPHVGMGDLGLPWKPNTEEIYVIGRRFSGHRGSSVLSFNAVSPNFETVDELREHPTQKPISLMVELLGKCTASTILDPFAGSGTTLVAAVRLGRKAIGVEIEEKYCEIAARRLDREIEQGRLFPPEPQPVEKQAELFT